MVVRDESEWLAVLRALDVPGEPGQAANLEYPQDFDRAAIQLRFEQLAALLSDAFGCPLAAGMGPCQDASCFGDIRIPPEFTVTRAKRSRIRFPVIVAVSNFGNLAACWAGQDAISPETLTSAAPPVHPEDRNRVEQALNELGYLFVPAEVLETRYDGPNQWVFGDRDESWLVRYFSSL
jgi:hypothetical protein